jgi:hypothetical protein
MPRQERLICVACDGNIDPSRKQLAGSRLWKLFLSARSLKRIKSDDSGCIDCRMKYLNWLKNVEGDFAQYDGCAEVSGSETMNVSFSR